MDASAPTGRHISFEEYLELERSSAIRHEYYQGEIFAMSGGSKNHNRLVEDTEIELQSLDLRFDLHTLYQYVDFGQPCGE